MVISGVWVGEEQSEINRTLPRRVEGNYGETETQDQHLR